MADPPAAGSSAPTYTFFDSYELIWRPMRPQRPHELLERPVRDGGDETFAAAFDFRQRVAVRCLIYAVLADQNWRDVIDGLLLPPPYALADLAAHPWTADEVEDYVHQIDPAWDTRLVLLPFRVAMRTGIYDARLRAACRRLCWIFNVPFAVVEAQEAAAAAAMRSLQPSPPETALPAADGFDEDSQRTPPWPSAAPGESEKQQQQGQIAQQRTHQKHSAQRIATIGGFAVLGGAALLVTGGMAAPMVASAYGALLSAATVTAGAIGALGSFVLGSGAVAAVFAAAVGVSTYAATLSALIAPVFSATTLTVLFGVGGATLGGYKALRRTADSSVFALRPVDSIEPLPPSSSLAVADEVAMTTTTPSPNDGDVTEAGAEGSSHAHWLGTTWDLTRIVEADSRPGLVVPSHTRSVAAMHVAGARALRKRHRRVVFAVDNQLPSDALQLKALKLVTGVWYMAPPTHLTYNEAGICAATNRFACPTGTEFQLCYVTAPRQGKEGVRVWVRVQYDFFARWQVACYAESASTVFDPFAAEFVLETATHEGDFTLTQAGLTMEFHRKPQPCLKVFLASDDETRAAGGVTDGEFHWSAIFPSAALAQRVVEVDYAVKQRRKIGIAVANRSHHGVLLHPLRLRKGDYWPPSASSAPAEVAAGALASHDASQLSLTLHTGEAVLSYLTNAAWSLDGAAGSFVAEVINRNDRPLTERYLVYMQCERSPLNQVKLAVVTARTARELRQVEVVPQAPANMRAEVPVRPGLFFALEVSVLPDTGVVQLLVLDGVEQRVASVAAAAARQRAALSVGVCGYTNVFDPRRPMEDQQVGLWQTVLADSTLLGVSEAYALQWEDEYLQQFGETIEIDIDLANDLKKRATSNVKGVVKRHIMQGAIFAGFQAYKSLLGAFELPAYAIWAADVIDNAFATLTNRAIYAGQDLASALLDPRRGNRPVTLVGYSFGCLVIAQCLRELDAVGALAVVENAYLLGCTFASDREDWLRLRRAVAGRLVNGYSRSDWPLWALHRMNATTLRPMAGLTAVNVPGVENVDLTPIVTQHSEYALKLRDALAAIPLQPTSESWDPRDRSGSPGIVVPLTEAVDTVRRMGQSLGGLLSTTPSAAIAMRNATLAGPVDGEAWSGPLEFVASVVFQGFFDFVPPLHIAPGQAGTFGVLGSMSDAAAGGMVAYRLPLAPSAQRDLLLVLFFYLPHRSRTASRGPPDVLPTAHLHLVTRHASEAEGAEAARERMSELATESFASLEDIRSLCQATHGRTASEAVPLKLSLEVPIPGYFTDQHRDATLQVECRRTGGGLLVDVLGLLTKTSSALQQQRFTMSQFVKLSLATSSSSSSSSGTFDASQPGGSGRTVAAVMGVEQMNGTLQQIADKVATTTATPSDAHFYLVLVNCAAMPLYMVAQEDDEAHGVNASEGGLLWGSLPPPSLPQCSFTVLHLPTRKLQGAPLPLLCYETANSTHRFEIRIAQTSQAERPFDAQHGLAAQPRMLTGTRAELTVSREVKSGAVFDVVMFNVQQTPHSAIDLGADTPELRAALLEYGWYVSFASLEMALFALPSIRFMVETPPTYSPPEMSGGGGELFALLPYAAVDVYDLATVEDCTPYALAALTGVRPRDLWLPVSLLATVVRGAEAGRQGHVTLTSAVPLALYDTATGCAVFDRTAIIQTLHAASTIDAAGTVTIDLDNIPTGHDLFARRQVTKVKRIPARTRVLLHAPMTKPASTKATRSTRGSRTDSTISRSHHFGTTSKSTTLVDTTTLADTLHAGQTRLERQRRSETDLEERLHRALHVARKANATAAVFAPAIAQRLLHRTAARIRRYNNSAPVHFVLPDVDRAASATVTVDGVTWSRLDSRILYHVFGSPTLSATPSRQLVLCFIDDVLLPPFHPTAPHAAETTTMMPTCEGGREEELLAQRTRVLAALHRYAARGYRIVLLDHYPALHHGNSVVLEERLRPLSRLCQAFCSTHSHTVSVLLSMMSYVTAADRGGVSTSFTLPSAGLLQVFVQQANSSLEPDSVTSVVIGKRQRGSPFVNELHTQFAANASLIYIDAMELER